MNVFKMEPGSKNDIFSLIYYNYANNNPYHCLLHY